VIPETYDSKIIEGTVLAVGPGRRLDSGELAAPDLEPGDHVVWRSNTNVVEIMGEDLDSRDRQEEELILIDERSIVAKRRKPTRQERKKRRPKLNEKL
jgi:co-chaperonin GroES (HSP10)